jgi:hypothetical protein
MNVANRCNRVKERMITGSMGQTGGGETVFILSLTRFQRFMIPVFWDMTPCTVGLYQCFEGSIALVITSTLQMGQESPPKYW